MPYKKLIIVLTIILVLLAGTLVAYNFFFTNEAPIDPDIVNNGPGPEPDDTPWNTDITPSPQAKIQTLSQEPVLAPTIDGQKVKYYSLSNGNVWQSSFDGSGLVRIFSVNLAGLKKVIWSPDKNKVINIVEDEGQIKKYFHDYVTGQSVALADSLQWIAWSPTSHKIAYQYYDQEIEANKISMSNPDGTDWQNVFNTRMKNLIIEWPKENQISFRTRPSGLAQSVVYTIDPQTNTLTKILSDRYGLSVLWSPQGTKLLFSETNDQGKNLKLKIADKDGRILTKLDIATLPEKCAWSQDERILFCAVPSVLSSEAILPDDYYKGLYSSTDDFWQINIETKQKSLLIEAGQMAQDFDAFELFLDSQEDYLFFINKKDGLLYSLKL